MCNLAMFSRLNVHEIVYFFVFIFHFFVLVFAWKKSNQPPDSASHSAMNHLSVNSPVIWKKFTGSFALFFMKIWEREKFYSYEWKSLPSTPSSASERAAKKLCTISIRLSSEGGNDEKIQFNVQLKFPSIFYLRLPSQCQRWSFVFPFIWLRI